jgi:hypothetical protein
MIPQTVPSFSPLSSERTWTKIRCNRSYELRLGSEVVGTLKRPSFWSPSFLAETQKGRWMFRRSGVLGSGAVIADSDSGESIATFRSAWGCGGVLTFADGQIFRFECRGWWHPVWSVLDANGEPVLHLHTREKTVDLPSPHTVPDDRLSLLVVFAWYRVLQAEEDAASAAVIAVIVAT